MLTPTEDGVALGEWAVVRYRDQRGREQTILRIVAGDGAVGYYAGRCDEDAIADAAPSVATLDLSDHDAMYRRFVEQRVPNAAARAWDLACWDLEARRRELPLWQVLADEATRERAMLYGDVRWGWFEDVEKFADCVRHRVENEGMHAVKLHVPGTWGLRYDGSEPPGLKTTMACLEAAREAVGPDVVLAYDPFNPEFFSFEEDMQVVDLLADCGYEWHEGGIPELPEEKWRPRYAELCAHARLRIEPEGRWEPGYEPTEDERLLEDLGVPERDVRFAEAGAAGQFHYDVHESGRGLTAGLLLVDTYAGRPELGIRLNFHWHWQPHQHLLFATDPDLHPYLECSSPASVPGRTEGGCLLPPDWIGCYDVDWDYIEENRL